jgi:cobalamin biosynthesis protein CbiG
MKCYDKCKIDKSICQVRNCRLWIDYPKDLNCTEIAVQKNDKMVFREIGERLNLTPSRVKQIETHSLKKLNKRLNILEDVF